jgi:hypothetical protein
VGTICPWPIRESQPQGGYLLLANSLVQIECSGPKTTLLKIAEGACPAAGHRAGGHCQSYRCCERRGHTGASGSQHEHLQVIMQRYGIRRGAEARSLQSTRSRRWSHTRLSPMGHGGAHMKWACHCRSLRLFGPSHHPPEAVFSEQTRSGGGDTCPFIPQR